MVKLVLWLIASAVIAQARLFTVSGISSGAAMSVQLHVAYSADCEGAGIIAGPPYYCAQGSSTLATTACMSTPAINVDNLATYAAGKAAQGKIDALENLKEDKVFLYSGTLDTVVLQPVVRQTKAFYERFIPSSQIKSVFTKPSEHTFPTEAWGNACVLLLEPYIGFCLYDVVADIFQQLYDALQPKGSAKDSNLYSFSQAEYVSGASMAETGYIYIPDSCHNTDCRVHVALHGCGQTTSVIGLVFVKHSGYNDWAESNSIIVLYPQAAVTLLTNPTGCWDWWGYTGADYADKSGQQMQAIYSMVQSLPSPLSKVTES
jgi:poly(3-hydroxybutyrate) depolymerase